MMRARTLLTLLSSSLAFLALAWGFARPGAGQNAAPEADLLTSPPFDRLTLNDGSVLRIEPVLPRPLPPYDATTEARRKRARTEIPKEGNIPLPGKKAK